MLAQVSQFIPQEADISRHSPDSQQSFVWPSGVSRQLTSTLLEVLSSGSWERDEKKSPWPTHNDTLQCRLSYLYGT